MKNVRLQVSWLIGMLITGLLLLLPQQMVSAKICQDARGNIIPCPETTRRPTRTPRPPTPTATPTVTATATATLTSTAKPSFTPSPSVTPTPASESAAIPTQAPSQTSGPSWVILLIVLGMLRLLAIAGIVFTVCRSSIFHTHTGRPIEVYDKLPYPKPSPSNVAPYAEEAEWGESASRSGASEPPGGDERGNEPEPDDKDRDR